MSISPVSNSGSSNATYQGSGLGLSVAGLNQDPKRLLFSITVEADGNGTEALYDDAVQALCDLINDAEGWECSGFEKLFVSTQMISSTNPTSEE